MPLRFLVFFISIIVITACTSQENRVGSNSLSSHHAQTFSGEKQPEAYLEEDACLLLKERPHWQETLIKNEEKWQLKPAVVLAFIYQESRFDPTALSSSNAYGYAQAKDDTWHWYQNKSGNIHAKRTHFDDAVDFMGFYISQNKIRNGTPVNDIKNQYLAYHEGMGGFELNSYLGKPWLLSVADKVEAHAKVYEQQLSTCLPNDFKY